MEKKLVEVKEIKTHGRVSKDEDAVTLFWTASGFECNVSGSFFWVELEVSYETFEPWIGYSINGDWVGRQPLPQGRYWLPLFRNMNPENVRKVRFWKETQAFAEDSDSLVILHSVRFDGKFSPVAEPKMRIEFIGDSITSGEGLFGAKKEWDWVPMFFSSSRNYHELTAQQLGADYQVFSQSGWGVLNGWNNNPHSALPNYYKEVCSLMGRGRAKKAGSLKSYDFTSFQPDYIVVNLGTNDEASFHQPEWIDEKTGQRHKMHLNEDGSYLDKDIEQFKDAVTSFLQTLRSCNPHAYLIWCYGMIGTPLEQAILHGIAEFQKKTGDQRVCYQRLPEVTEETFGCREHPGILCHQQAAEVLVPLIEALDEK